MLIVLCHYTGGAACWIPAIMGTIWAVSKQGAKALCCLILLPLFTELNPVISNCHGTVFSLAVRLGPLIIGLLLFLVSSSRKVSSVPICLFLIYLPVAFISSLNGYAPIISCLKLINFLVFIIALWLGSKCLSCNMQDVYFVRALIMSICVIIIVGSFVLIPFPGVSELSAKSLIKEGMTIEEANTIIRQSAQEGLFCGITNQSQTLGPILGLCIGWLLSDMVFVMKRFTKLHSLLIILSLPMLLYTRSRCALLVAVSAVFMVLFYAARRIRIPTYLKIRLKHGIYLSLLLLVIFGFVLEIRNNTFSRWIRKTDDVVGDDRSMVEAVTNSRMGKVEESLYDFRQSPMFGMGFQVSYTTKLWYGDGFVLSAPIEKGVIPTMILGETGVVGLIVFIFIMIGFYLSCGQKHCYVTYALFITFFMANMGEATFFSPGGSGGILWMISILGGYAIDCAVEKNKNLVFLP